MVIAAHKWTILTKTGVDIDIPSSFCKVERANNQCDKLLLSQF
jgi:hypothetical protein